MNRFNVRRVAVLGVHEVEGTHVLRAFIPGAETLEAIDDAEHVLATLERTHDAGFFEGPIEGRRRYWLRATRGADTPSDAAMLCEQSGVRGVVWRVAWRRSAHSCSCACSPR